MISKRQARAIIKSNFGRNPVETGISFYDATSRMDKTRVYHDEMMKEKNTESGYIDDITWDDLEMDDVFLRINHTDSFAGEQILYHKLHEVGRSDFKLQSNSEGVNKDTNESIEEKIQFVTENPQIREKMETNLFAVGKTKNDYHMVSFLKNADIWKIEHAWALYVMQALLAVFIVTSIIFQNIVCYAGLVVVALANLLIYTVTKKKYAAFFDSIGDFKRVYDFAAWVTKDEKLDQVYGSDEVRAAVDKLKGMSNTIVNFNTRQQGTLSGDLSAVLLDYIFGITLFDVTMFNKVMKKIENKLDEVISLIEFTGEIDMTISIASYRESLDMWCIPEFEKAYEESKKAKIKAESLVHPLLSSPVANDFDLDDWAIITGANASGKSTFMKAFAINVIMAQTINTCTAQQFFTTHMHVMTCMSLRDDILSGESYYFREARYLKRMIDEIDSGNRVLCVVDEILKGTNTHERIAASKAILDYIAKNNCFVLIATHDMELTENEHYTKFYFDSTVQDNDIVFDYKIHSGIGGKSNAIALLEILGYPRTIVEQARINQR